MKSLKNIIRKNQILFCSLFAICLGAFGFSTNLAAQDTTEYKVSGVVLDAHTKQPISAVQISTLSLTASALTDEKGTFEITLKDKNDVLLVSTFDYDILEYPVRSKTEVAIHLYPKSFTDNYKNIDGLNGRGRKSYQVNAINQIETFEKTGAVSADELIQNQLGGAVRSISHSGTVGIGSSMFIRGINSINSNAQPLFIVDGIIWDNLTDAYSINQGYLNNPLLHIDVNDIASISVVKDGTAIYGTKAANGVILINTKRGEDIVTKIDVNLMKGVTQTPRALPVMSGDDYRIYTGELISTNPNIPVQNIGNFDFLNDDVTSPLYNTYHNSTNWNDEIYDLGTTDGYSVGVNGGDARALYNFSMGYTGNNGVLRNTNMQRINIRFNADFKFDEIFDLGLILALTSVDRELLDDGISFNTSPSYVSSVKAPFLSPYTFTAEGDRTLDYADGDLFSISNPLALIKNSKNKFKQYRFNIGFNPRLKINPWLKIVDQFDYSLYRTKEAVYISPAGFPSLASNLEDPIESISMGQMYRNFAIYNNLKINFNKSFGSHSFDADLGTRLTFNEFHSDYTGGYNASEKDPFVNGGLLGLSLDGIGYKHINVTDYLNLVYDYDKRFFIHASAALDASSRFGKDVEGSIKMFGQSWGLFPSINAAWLVSSENFMKSIDFVNFMKLRVGYDITGNDDIPDYLNSPSFTTKKYAYSATGIVIGNIGNTGIKWEETSKINAGVELGLFNERVGLTFDLFSSKTKDLLMLKELPDITGMDYYWDNDGELSNKGYEVSATIKAINLKNFQWEVGMNVGHYQNEITSLPKNNDGSEIVINSVYGGYVASAKGYSVGSFYGYKTNGVYATSADAATADLKMYNSAGQLISFNAGDVAFVDQLTDSNNDGVADKFDGIIDKKDMVVIGDPNPDFYGSFNSKFSYKNFSVNAFFTYSYGNDIYNYHRQMLESGSLFFNQSTAMLSRWSYEGQVTNQPKAVYGDPMMNSRFSDRWIEDGSYIKLKSLTFSYDFNLKNMPVEGINVWASANNLWTLTDYLGLDPEVSSQNSVLYQGVDNGLLPSSKSFFIGVKLSL